MKLGLSVVPIVPLLLACGDSTGVFTGAYVLTAIDSVAVPHIVAATLTCDELVLSGELFLGTGGSFELHVRQAQDCSAGGGSVDTFSTTVAGSYTTSGTRFTLHPIGTGLTYEGIGTGGTVEIELPPFPFISVAPHRAQFVIFPV